MASVGKKQTDLHLGSRKRLQRKVLELVLQSIGTFRAKTAAQGKGMARKKTMVDRDYIHRASRAPMGERANSEAGATRGQEHSLWYIL